jgi:hypothetical protein
MIQTCITSSFRTFDGRNDGGSVGASDEGIELASSVLVRDIFLSLSQKRHMRPLLETRSNGLAMITWLRVVFTAQELWCLPNELSKMNQSGPSPGTTCRPPALFHFFVAAQIRHIIQS